MVEEPTYSLAFRRRREGKTSYRRRKALVLSGKPRLVVRTSNKNLTVQLIEARPDGDHVLASAHSRELLRLGWKGDRNNIPAAYLVGYLAGYRGFKKRIGEAVLDIGLNSKVPGSRIAAALKGALDAGLRTRHGGEFLPRPERIRGEHIAAYAKMLSGNPRVYEAHFSEYLRRGLRPEDLPVHFEETRRKLVGLAESGEGI